MEISENRFKKLKKITVFVILFLLSFYIFLVIHEITHVKLAYYFNAKFVGQNVFAFDLEINTDNMSSQDVRDLDYLNSWNEILSTVVLGFYMLFLCYFLFKIGTEE